MIVEKPLDTSKAMMCRNAPSNSHNTGDFKLLLPIWQYLLGFKMHTFDSAIPLIRNLSSRNNSIRILKKKKVCTRITTELFISAKFGKLKVHQ